MAIDRVGSGSAAQRASEQLAQARAAAARVATPETGGTGARRAADTTTDATGIIARAAARAASLQSLTAKAETVSAALEETTGLLDEMREILRDQAKGAKSGGLDEARARLASIAASIARAEARASGTDAEGTGGVSVVALTSAQLPPVFQQGFVVANVSLGVQRVAGKTSLPPGSVRDVELQVLTSATTAQIGINFHGAGGEGTSFINASFTIEIEGADGVATLSFVSGTSVIDIARAINSQTAQTGVIASEDGNFLALNAEQLDGQFVSVRILEDSGVAGTIYSSSEDWQYFGDLDPDDVFRDDSSEFHATIAGQPITIVGNRITSNTSEWSLQIDFDLEQFNHSGTYDLFLLFATGGPEFQPADTPPEFGAPVEAGAAALREGTLTSADASSGRAGVDRVDSVRAGVDTRLAEIRALLQGSLGEARASADATLASLLRDGPKSGWRIDAEG